MSDPTQYVVNLSTAHRILQHEGVIGVGRDFMTGTPCTLHYYVDRFKRNYVMLMFEGVDADFVSNKLNSVAKSAHSASLPNLIRPSFFTTRKINKAAFELTIFYDTQGLGELTLAQIIQSKRASNQKFQADELVAFFWQVADFFLLSGKGNSEYFDLSPENIYCKVQGYYGYNFFLSSFGKQNKQKRYQNPSDRFYNQQKSHEAGQSAALFAFGMILLEMASMLPSKDLYDEKGYVNQKVLLKRIQGVKIINDKLISTAVRQLLEFVQTKRLKVSDIYKNEEWLKLRKVSYYQSKRDFFEYRSFEGVVQYDKKTSIGEALDKDLAMVRGTFNNGVFEGRGVKQNGANLQAGIFYAGQLVQGQSIRKSSHIDIGKFKGGMLQQGLRICLNIATMSKQGRGMSGFIGDFLNGEPGKGKVIFTDGSEQQQ